MTAVRLRFKGSERMRGIAWWSLWHCDSHVCSSQSYDLLIKCARDTIEFDDGLFWFSSVHNQSIIAFVTLTYEMVVVIAITCKRCLQCCALVTLAFIPFASISCGSVFWVAQVKGHLEGVDALCQSFMGATTLQQRSTCFHMFPHHFNNDTSTWLSCCNVWVCLSIGEVCVRPLGFGLHGWVAN